ncbi:MAG TPA: LuxR C-terminal-related transcriptional regulator [Chloroflexota bacterium]|nr:LuxR C-terminal-related transcriptional regulator [Chloroflexota bacterium]
MMDGGSRVPGEELAALQLLARGYSAEQIARLLQTTPAEVRTRLDRVMLRLGAHSHQHAVAIALRLDLIV